MIDGLGVAVAVEVVPLAVVEGSGLLLRCLRLFLVHSRRVLADAGAVALE